MRARRSAENPCDVLRDGTARAACATARDGSVYTGCQRRRRRILPADQTDMAFGTPWGSRFSRMETPCGIRLQPD